ncbi:MAG: hypothetical protein ACI97A_001942 [Planctomycetota bacterium]|jgi:hypothetical protein
MGPCVQSVDIHAGHAGGPILLAQNYLWRIFLIRALTRASTKKEYSGDFFADSKGWGDGGGGRRAPGYIPTEWANGNALREA